MSVQFGRWNFDGKPVDPKDLDEVRPVLAPYGPDGEGYICRDNLGVLYRAFCTTKESRDEVQPRVTPSGAVITLDGRLDNREELIAQLGREFSASPSDVAIVAAAYERWQTGSFARLIGDWALSIWDSGHGNLILAKDFVGTRQLYYSIEKDRVTWCTILDPLVLFAGHSFELEEEYIAGCLSFFPAPHLTPYAGICSVPPSSFVRLANGAQTITKYWDFDPAKTICYRTDSEYEEHFRIAFADSVRRRLHCDTPVLAELSGGMDSSSIVCMADLLLNKRAASTPRLDTLSYYSDLEPNWDERSYFTRVEEERGQVGCHIDVGGEEPTLFSESDDFAVTPGSFRDRSEVQRRFASFVGSRGIRVILSGTGGDEVLGGVPTPVPLLADLLVTANYRSFLTQLTAWSIANRKPAIHLFAQTIQALLPSGLAQIALNSRLPRWLGTDFVNRNKTALLGYRASLRFRGSLPSFQDNLNTLSGLRRQLGSSALPSQPPIEKRYPFLDRNLLEFLYAIPQDQLLRPGQRRSLMRRALIGIVPDEVLNRRRKAFVARGPLCSIITQWNVLLDISSQMLSEAMGVVDAEEFRAALKRARNGQVVQLVPLLRTIGIERWLRAVHRWQNQKSCEREGDRESKQFRNSNVRLGRAVAPKRWLGLIRRPDSIVSSAITEIQGGKALGSSAREFQLYNLITTPAYEAAE